MMRRLRARLTYPNVVATLALFIALGGTSYAAVVVADGSVKTRHLAAGAVTSPKLSDGGVGRSDLGSNSVTSPKLSDGGVGRADLGANAVTSPKVSNGSLKAEDFAAGQLPRGEKGETGPQGEPGVDGEDGAAGPPLGSFDTLDGLSCTRSGEAGTTDLTYGQDGAAILKCELPELPEPPSAEVCDGLDNDGDQLIDNLTSPPTLPNAVARCEGGQVVIDSCNVDYHDINSIASDGCEYGPVAYTGEETCDGLDNDADGMVDDGVVLPSVPNGFLTCQGGSQVLFCDEGWTDANGDQNDGCEEAVITSQTLTAPRIEGTVEP